MENQVRIVCCCKDPLIWRIFPILSIILYSAKFSAFFPTEWFHQGKGMKKWKGNMFSVYSAGGLIDEKKYSVLSEYYCAEQTTFTYSFTNTGITYYDAGSLCTLFEALSSGMAGLIAFSVISFIIGISLNLLLKFGKTKACKFNCALFLNIAQFFSEFSCMICIGASSKFTLYGDCNYLSYNESSSTTYPVHTCLDTGGIYSFFASLSILLLNFSMIVLIILYKCSKEIIEEPANQVEIVLSSINAPHYEQNTPNNNPVRDTKKPPENLGFIGDDKPIESVD